MFHYVIWEPFFPELKYQKFLMVFLEGLLEVEGILVVVFEKRENLLVVLEGIKHVVLVDFGEIKYFGFPYLLSNRVLDVVGAWYWSGFEDIFTQSIVWLGYWWFAHWFGDQRLNKLSKFYLPIDLLILKSNIVSIRFKGSSKLNKQPKSYKLIYIWGR